MTDDGAQGAAPPAEAKPIAPARAPARDPVRPTTFEEWVRSVVRQPEIVRAVHLHAPVALARGRTPVEVSVSGVGVLTVDDYARFVWGACTTTVFVRAQPKVTVRFVGLTAFSSQELSLSSVVHEVPRRVVVTKSAPDMLEEEPRLSLSLALPRAPDVGSAFAVPSRAEIAALADVRASAPDARAPVDRVLQVLASRVASLAVRARVEIPVVEGDVDER